MPIEFRCRRCQKLLRTPDDTVGKQAQCPQCGEVQTIPPPAQAAAPIAPPVANPFTTPPAQPAPAVNGGPAAGAYNPYQAPSASTAPPVHAWQSGPRNGPPWEAEGPSPGSFWATIKEFFSDVSGFFATMRVEGGIGLPLLFMLICAAIGGLGYALQQAALAAVGVAMPGGAMPDNPAETAGFFVGLILGGLCGVAFIALLISFISSAIYHVMLLLLGGANNGFEATYRVVAYTSGLSFLMYLIPCCGNYIGGLASIVLTIVGLAYGHDTSGWRAAGAVLLPMGVCCIAGIGLAAALVGLNQG
jgi:hypothetical protein